MAFLTLILVSIAGAVGAAARYGISNLFHGDALPWSTVGINVLGSFLLGVLIVIPWGWIGPELRTALGVGLLGGFTTFSTFSVQAVTDFEAGLPLRALAYIATSVLLSLAAAAVGYFGGRALFA
jgi:CrcB protein